MSPLIRSRRGLCLAATCALLAGGLAREAGALDVVPFRVLHGRPPSLPPDDPAGAPRCDLWLEGGRLHLLFEPGQAPATIDGRLLLEEGAIKDVQIGSEAFQIRQGKPERLLWEIPLGAQSETLSVTLSGDFSALTVDMTVNGREIPSALRIGERGARARSLPLRLDLGPARGDWIERFGFH